jgi:hypothetical protein
MQTKTHAMTDNCAVEGCDSHNGIAACATVGHEDLNMSESVTKNVDKQRFEV